MKFSFFIIIIIMTEIKEKDKRKRKVIRREFYFLFLTRQWMRYIEPYMNSNVSRVDDKIHDKITHALDFFSLHVLLHL